MVDDRIFSLSFMPSVYSLTFLLWTTQNPNQLLMFIPILIETIALSYQQPVPIAFHPISFDPSQSMYLMMRSAMIGYRRRLSRPASLCVFDAKDRRTADLLLWSWDFIIEGGSGSRSGHRPCGPDLRGKCWRTKQCDVEHGRIRWLFWAGSHDCGHFTQGPPSTAGVLPQGFLSITCVLVERAFCKLSQFHQGIKLSVFGAS